MVSVRPWSVCWLAETCSAAAVYNMGATFQRIYVTFGRYRPESIKAGMRTKRKQGKRPVRRQIETE